MHNVTELMGLSYELRIDLTSFPREENGQFTGPIELGYAKYTTFSVGSPESFYLLTATGYSGDWGKNALRSVTPEPSQRMELLIRHHVTSLA